MLGLGRTDSVRGAAMAGRDEDIYRRYGADLYRQAMLTLDDAAQAEQVVCDVIAGERALAPAPRRGADDTRRRLAESAFRCCQELAAPGTGAERHRGQEATEATVGDAAADVPLSGQERAALGLVLYGGLGYTQAGTVLGVGPQEMAILLRGALRRLATSYAVADGSRSLACVRWALACRAGVARLGGAGLPACGRD